MTPLFVISLPRSGSTWLQRILSTASSIETVAEPWINLPLAAALPEFSGNIYSVSSYSTSNADIGIREFTSTIASDEVYRATHDYVMKLYGARCSRDCLYFLDKTPRYYYIIDYLIKIFPEAKYIFLTRKLDAVAKSIFTTWYGGQYMLYHHYSDLTLGPKLILDGWNKLSSKALLLSYEELILDPEGTISTIEQYLELSKGTLNVSKASAIRIEGTMGDPIGQYKENFVKSDEIVAFGSRMQRRAVKRRLSEVPAEARSFFGETDSIVKYRETPVLAELRDLKGIFAANTALGLQKLLGNSLFFRGRNVANRFKLS